MALVRLERSPPISDIEVEENDEEIHESECFFAGKCTALLIKDDKSSSSLNNIIIERRLSTDSNKSTNSTQSSSSDIQQHLQQMFVLLRREETLKMAVKLESQRPNRTRYLVIVSHTFSESNYKKNKNRRKKLDSDKEKQQQQQSVDSLEIKDNKEQLDKSSDINITPILNKKSKSLDNNAKDVEESCLVGIDCNEKTTIGLVLPILADTTIRLDGDGGFSVTVYNKTHIFKPVSVQAMWSALQSLHKVSKKARENNLYPGGPSHSWVTIYESRIDSDRSCLNEWNTMDALEIKRPPSPDAIRNKPTEKEETEKIIKMKLREIMMSVDLDEVTSKYIRGRLEELLDMDLGEYKSYIDEEMLTIMGQMDAPTKIFEHVYLGSEWNASNLEELQKNGVRHILNVTREIDNFFPGMFDYYNVRVYDDEKTNLLKYWDNTFKYINSAKAKGSKVLVHCKMGVSRSASVVIAYAMKAYNWNFEQAMNHVKQRRNCIKPNKNFLAQLETYRGMLDAMKNKEKLQRSKSETNLKSVKDARLLPGSEPTPLIQALNQSKLQLTHNLNYINKESHRKLNRRSSSTSPKIVQNPIVIKQQSQSLENLTPDRHQHDEQLQRNVRHTGNGENYSITQNQVLHLQKYAGISSVLSAINISASAAAAALKVKNIVNDLEGTGCYMDKKTIDDRRSLNLQLYDDNKIPVWTSSSKLIQQTTSNSDQIKLDDIMSSSDPIESSASAATNRKMSYVQKWQANNLFQSNPNMNPSNNWESKSENKYERTSYRGSLNSDPRILRNSSWSAYDTSKKNYRFSNPAIMEGQVAKDFLNNTSERTNKRKIRTDSTSSADKTTKSATTQFHSQRCNSEEIILYSTQNNKQLDSSYRTLPKLTDKSSINLFQQNDNLDSSSTSSSICTSGKAFSNNVQNLKKNFEAKVNISASQASKESQTNNNNNNIINININNSNNNNNLNNNSNNNNNKKGNSLPTSPTLNLTMSLNKKEDSNTDLSVKGLVNKYQVASGGSRASSRLEQSRIRPRSFYESRSSSSSCSNKPQLNDLVDKSINYHQQQEQKAMQINNSTTSSTTTTANDSKRPPVPPTVLFKTNLTNPLSMTESILKQNFSCNLRKQHGKSHPLSKIKLHQRCSNAYNTM